eukprot:82515-Ditylum_brightwellii.AAC.1
MSSSNSKDKDWSVWEMGPSKTGIVGGKRTWTKNTKYQDDILTQDLPKWAKHTSKSKSMITPTSSSVSKTTPKKMLWKQSETNAANKVCIDATDEQKSRASSSSDNIKLQGDSASSITEPKQSNGQFITHSDSTSTTTRSKQSYNQFINLA